MRLIALGCRWAVAFSLLLPCCGADPGKADRPRLPETVYQGPWGFIPGYDELERLVLRSGTEYYRDFERGLIFYEFQAGGKLYFASLMPTAKNLLICGRRFTGECGAPLIYHNYRTSPYYRNAVTFYSSVRGRCRILYFDGQNILPNGLVVPEGTIRFRWECDASPGEQEIAVDEWLYPDGSVNYVDPAGHYFTVEPASAWTLNPEAISESLRPVRFERLPGLAGGLP